MEETKKYDIIFRGSVESVKECGDKSGEANFKVEELFKGNAGEHFVVVFRCDHECARNFRAGEEWIIYSNYSQVNRAAMDWCSRSRKYFRFAKEDYYTATYGNDYDEEFQFLREKLGQHRLLEEKDGRSENRNIIPDRTQMVIILLISLVVIVLFYWLFNRVFR